MPPAIWVASAAGAWAGDSSGVSFVVPTKIRPRDVMLAIVLFVSTTNTIADADGVAVAASDWTILTTITTAANRMIVLARTVGDAEVATRALTFAADTDGMAALLVYRDLDIGAVIAAAGNNIAASVAFTSPSLALVRYSDIYIGASIAGVAGGVAAPPAGCTERIDFASATRVMEVFDLLPEAAGATGTKTATRTASSGAAFAFALGAGPLIGQDKGFAFDPPGAPGLPTEGV